MGVKTKLLTAACLIFFLHARGQQSWTLQQCIDYALAHNLEIKQSSLNTELSAYQVDQSKANLLPSLNGNATRNYSYGRSIDPYTNLPTNNEVVYNSLGLNSGVTLFDGFQLMNTLRMSKLDYLSSQSEEQKVRDDMTLNVATAYLQVLYTKENMRNTRELMEATRVQRDKTQRLFDAGSVSKVNLLDLESQLALDEVNLATAGADSAQAMLTLTQLLELENPAGFDIQDPGIAAPTSYQLPADVNTVYQAALNTQPGIRASDYRMQSAERSLSIARGGRSPRLTMSGSISTSTSSSNRQIESTLLGPPSLIGYTAGGDTVFSDRPSIIGYTIGDIPVSEQLDNNLFKTFGFNLSIPIFNGWATRTGIKRAEVGLQQARLNHDQTKKTLYKSVQIAYTDAMSSYQKYLAGEKSLAASEEAFHANDQRYNLGLISTYDYLISKNNLARAKTSLLQAKYDYIFRIKVLDFYQGKPLAF